MLFEKDIKLVNKKIKNGKTKKEICNTCTIRQGAIRFCFRCPAKDLNK